MIKQLETAVKKYRILLDLIFPAAELNSSVIDNIMNIMDELYIMTDDERAEVRSQIEKDIYSATKALKSRLAESFRSNMEQYSEEVGNYAANNEVLNKLEPREKNNDHNGTEEVTTF